MNRSFFSKTKYMIGVGLKKTGSHFRTNAFDVVDHTILLNKLYEEGINQKIWLIVRELYSGLIAKIKWKSVLGDSFKVFQGVRQGGVISTRFYMVYINGVMIELRMNSLGK